MAQKEMPCKNKAILSLVGLLQHATKVFKLGRTLVSRMYATTVRAKKLSQRTRLTAEFKSDLLWWYLLLPPGMESALCTTHKKVPLIIDYGLMFLVHGAAVHDLETNGFSSAGFLSGCQLP